MAMIITAESELGKELAKWNVKRPFSPFPRMLYMARRRPDGVPSTGEVDDKIFGGQPGAAETWSNGCYRVVEDEDEQRKAMSLGWRFTPAEAMERFHEKELTLANQAAMRAYEDRNMSAAAKAEAAEAEASTEEHVAEIPEAPKKRGRTTKH